MLETLLLLFLKALFLLLRILPLRASHLIVFALLKFFLWLAPKHTRVARRNIQLAFPEKDQKWHEEIYRLSLSEIARTIVDAARLPSLSKAWVQKNIVFPRQEEFEALKSQSPTGILIATGHLGSFELLAHGSAHYGHPLSFIVRDFTLPKIDRWWRSIREASGNEVISRKGAVKLMMQRLKQRRCVGILFDQNVTRNHAVFVQFFGIPAATTKAVAMTVLKIGCPLLVASVRKLEGDRYCMDWSQIPVEEVVQSQLPHDEKVEQITLMANQAFEEMVRQSPASWFWFHRRWKTRPKETDLGLY